MALSAASSRSGCGFAWWMWLGCVRTAVAVRPGGIPPDSSSSTQFALQNGDGDGVRWRFVIAAAKTGPVESGRAGFVAWQLYASRGGGFASGGKREPVSTSGTGGIPPNHGQVVPPLRFAVSSWLRKLLSWTAASIRASWSEDVLVVEALTGASRWNNDGHSSEVHPSVAADAGGIPPDHVVGR